MRFSIGFALPVLFGTVMMAGPARSQEFAVNGDFEAVQIVSPFFSSNPANVPSWTHTGTVGDALIWGVGYVDGGGSITTAGSGNQFVTMGGGSTAPGSGQWSQTLVGLSPGSVYNLKFKMASETSNLAQQMTVDFTSGSSTGAQIFSAANSPANYWRGWESKSMQFVTTGSSVGLRFSATTGQDVGLDSVSVQAAATPEPGSVALLTGLGLSGAVFLKRRRKQAPRL